MVESTSNLNIIIKDDINPKEKEILDKLQLISKELNEKENRLEKVKKDVITNEQILKNHENSLPKEYARFQEELKIRDKQVLTLKDAVEVKTMKTNEIIKSYEEKLNQKTVYIKSLNKSFDDKLAEQAIYLEELKRLQIQKDLEISALQDEKKQFEKLNEELSVKIKKNELIELELLTVQNEKKVLEEEIKNLNKKNEQLVGVVDQLSDTNKEMEKRINNLELKYFEYDKHKSQMQNKILEYELENSKLKEKLSMESEERDKENLTIKEDFEKQIKDLNEKIFNLSMSLDTKTKIIDLNTKLIDDLNQKISDLAQKNEDQSMKIIKQSLENIENEKNFNQKLLDNKQKFDDELTKNIKNYESKVEKIENLSNLQKFKELEDNLKNLKKQYNKVNTEKIEFEQIILTQEEKVNELGQKVKGIDQMLKNKNNQLSAYETQCMGLIKIIEDQKKQLKLNKTVNSFNRDNKEKTQEFNFKTPSANINQTVGTERERVGLNSGGGNFSQIINEIKDDFNYNPNNDRDKIKSSGFPTSNTITTSLTMKINEIDKVKMGLSTMKNEQLNLDNQNKKNQETINKQLDDIKKLKKKVIKSSSSYTTPMPKPVKSEKALPIIELNRDNANNNVNNNQTALTKKSKLEPIGVLKNRKVSSSQIADLSPHNNFTINEDDNENSNANLKEISLLMKKILEDN